MIHAIVASLIFAQATCDQEVLSGSGLDLLQCAEGQTGWRQRHIRALALFRLQNIEGGEFEGAKALALAPEAVKLAVDKAQARARKRALELAEALRNEFWTQKCVSATKVLGIPVKPQTGGGISVVGKVPNKELWNMEVGDDEVESLKVMKVIGLKKSDLLSITNIADNKAPEGSGTVKWR